MISLFAREERDAKRQSLNDPLAVLARHIDFGAIAEAVEAKLTLGRSGRGGRPPYPTVVMIKLLLLQQVPDAKTLWVWRERLIEQDLMGQISAAVSGQLQRAGFIARGGQIIDASLVTAPIQRHTRQENAAIKQGQVPEDWSAPKRA